MKPATALAAILCVLALGAAAQTTEFNRDPEKARIVTTDLENFWRAYDLAGEAPSPEKKTEIFEREYIQKGTPGLEGFMRGRIVSAAKLVENIVKMPKFYASVRATSMNAKSMQPQVTKSFRKLKELYHDAIFPDVYLVIGRANSGGTISRTGILIGMEMHSLSESTPKEELGSWLSNVLAPVENLPYIIAHESIHYQQRSPQKTLLEKAIQEGGADFISELIAGRHINEKQHAFGNKNERALWLEFKQSMNGTDLSKWLYDGNRARNRPSDMGYYMGYKICEAFYKRSADKKKAIREILLMKDAAEFLRRSGYAQKFE